MPRFASRAGDHAFEDARRVAQAGPDDRRLAYVHSLIIIALSSPWLRRTPPPRAPLSTKSTIRSVALAWPSTPRAPPAASPPTASPPWLRRVLEPPSSPRRYPGPRLVLSQPFSRLSRRRDACLKLSSFEGHPRHMPPRDILRLLRCFWCVCLTTLVRGVNGRHPLAVECSLHNGIQKFNTHVPTRYSKRGELYAKQKTRARLSASS